MKYALQAQPQNPTALPTLHRSGCNVRSIYCVGVPERHQEPAKVSMFLPRTKNANGGHTRCRTRRQRIIRYTESQHVSMSQRSATSGTSTGSSGGPNVPLVLPSLMIC